MKRFFLFFALVSLIYTAGSQNITKTIGQENKKINVGQINGMKILGKDDGLTIAVTNKYNSVLGNYIKKECQILALDENTNIVRSLEIPETKDHTIVASSIYEGKIYILTQYEKRHDVTFQRYVIDSKQMTLVGEPTTILSYQTQRKDNDYNWVEQSPNGLLTGFIHITTNRKSDKFEAYEMLLDEEMNVEWRHEYPIYSLSNIFVSDDGEILTFGKSAWQKGQPSKIYFSLITADNSSDYSEDTRLAITDSRLISYNNGKLLGTGIGVTPTNNEGVEYFGFVLDTKKSTVNISYQPLTDVDKNVYSDFDLGRRVITPSTDALVMRHCKATDFGGVCTIQQRWAVQICNQNGGCSVTYYMSGTIVYGLDDNGEIIWHHPIRSNCLQKNNNLLLANSLLVKGNDIFFLQSENPKWPATYDIKKSEKTFKVSKGSKVIGVYHIDANGAISKYNELLLKKGILAGSMEVVDDEYIGFLSLGKGATMIKMSINN